VVLKWLRTALPNRFHGVLTMEEDTKLDPVAKRKGHAEDCATIADDEFRRTSIFNP
jgi:hypothetical protein